MHVQAEHLYFIFLFSARHYPWWSLWQKNTKNNYFIKVKPPFSVIEFSNTVTFWRNARFDVILTSVTIIKQGFFSQIVLLWVTCWHRSIKTLNIFIIDTAYSIGSSDVITYVNIMTPINPLYFYENKRWIHGCLIWNYKRSVWITSLLRIIRNFN